MVIASAYTSLSDMPAALMSVRSAASEVSRSYSLMINRISLLPRDAGKARESVQSAAGNVVSWGARRSSTVGNGNQTSRPAGSTDLTSIVAVTRDVESATGSRGAGPHTAIVSAVGSAPSKLSDAERSAVS